MKAKRSAQQLATQIEFGVLFLADHCEDSAHGSMFEVNNPMALGKHLSSGGSLKRVTVSRDQQSVTLKLKFVWQSEGPVHSRISNPGFLYGLGQIFG